ncbi:MAG: AAA family ATPase [Bacilli bacterium]|nr:AAA family ATPase [Bacilli bacterium]
MRKTKIIHIFGSSGSGSTTLARALSEKYGFHFIDTDDAIWEKTDPPFSVKKSEVESRNYLEKELTLHQRSVISGAFVGWGDVFKKDVDLFVYLHLPLSIRLKRIQIRERNRFGKRILPGGDLYQQHLDFLDWVSQYELTPADVRGQKQHELWLQEVNVPIIRIVEPLPVEQLLKLAEPYINI